MEFDKVYVGIIAALVLIIVYLFVQSSQTSAAIAGQQAVSNIVKDIYELQYESATEILNVEERSDVYKIVVRFTDYTGQQVTQDVYVTKDGKLLTDRFIITDKYKIALENQKGFIECMRDKGLRILGQTNDTATLQQLTLLGGYSYKLFVSCDGASEAACRNLGVERYPTTVYNNTGYANIYDAAFFTQLTGCTLTLP